MSQPDDFATVPPLDPVEPDTDAPAELRSTETLPPAVDPYDTVPAAPPAAVDARAPAATKDELLIMVEAYEAIFNTRRPHQSLDGSTPHVVYTATAKDAPSPGGPGSRRFLHEVTVTPAGHVDIARTRIRLGRASDAAHPRGRAPPPRGGGPPSAPSPRRGRAARANRYAFRFSNGTMNGPNTSANGRAGPGGPRRAAAVRQRRRRTSQTR